MASRGPRLESTRDVSKFLARILREVYRGDLKPRVAGTLIYGCNVLKSCLESADLERRVEELELQLKNANTPGLSTWDESQKRA